jgi:Uma2 family endonuclease
MMSNTTGYCTAEHLASLPDDGNRYELVEGVLHMMSPAGGRHGRVAAKLLLRIGNYVELHKLGSTFAAETGFLIERDPDTVRAADVSFVSHTRLAGQADHPGYLPVAPELVAEVVSPGDKSSQVESKAVGWLHAGVHVVLVVDPQISTIRCYRSPEQITVFRHGMLDLGDVLPGFELDVSEVFA